MGPNQATFPCVGPFQTNLFLLCGLVLLGSCHLILYSDEDDGMPAAQGNPGPVESDGRLVALLAWEVGRGCFLYHDSCIGRRRTGIEHHPSGNLVASHRPSVIHGKRIRTRMSARGDKHSRVRMPPAVEVVSTG